MIKLSFILFIIAEMTFAKTPVGNPVQTRRAKETVFQLAQKRQEEADEARQALRYVSRDPYIPQKYDYGTELGVAWSKRSYYAVGAMVGFHIDTCMFSQSQTCQQYFDIIFNVHGRDGYTNYLGLGSLRWQFIRFPSSWSPFARVIAGVSNDIVPGEVVQSFVYGAGIGITTFLHPKADLRVELRGFQADEFYAEALFSVQFKMERWLEFFAEKLKDIGVGTTTVVTDVVGGVGGVVIEGVEEVGEATGIKKSNSQTEEKKKADQP